MDSIIRMGRSEWGPGPWEDEPDEDTWTDKATGLPCHACRSRLGAWCGYVQVPDGHSWHGLDFGDEALWDVQVHWGPTFSGPMRDAEGWWLGFDCAHLHDLVPAYQYDDDCTYRTLGYVRRQCANLARQIAEVPRATD